MSMNFGFGGRFAFSHHATHRMCNISPTKLAECLRIAGVPFNKDWVQEYQQKGWSPMKPRFCEDTWATMNAEQRAKLIDLLPAAEEYTRTSMGKPVNQWKNESGEYPSKDKSVKIPENVEREAEQVISVEDVSFTQVDKPKSAKDTDLSKLEDRVMAQVEAKAKEEKRAKVKQDIDTGKSNPLYQAVRDVCVAVIAEEGADYFEEEAIEKVARKVVEEALRNVPKASVDKSEVIKLIEQHATKVTRVEVKDAKSKEVTFTGVAHKLFPKLLQLMECGFPIWIPGPAGSGKTTAVNHACKALGATLYMPPEGPIENKYGMIGYMDASGNFVEPTLYKAAKEASANPDKTVVYFIDECDAGYANALMVLNAVMENGYCTFANGERVEYGRNLMFIAGANTFGNGATNEYVGRNKLDAATLDRFITLAWDYDGELERAIAGNDDWTRKVQRIRDAVRTLAIKAVVTPRASIRGAKLLEAGFKESEVLDMVVFKGMTADQVRSIKSHV